MVDKVLFSSATEEWATPQELFDRLNAKYQFTIDVCATPENAKCQRFYTKEDDGLSKDWSGERVWCNPPYGRVISEWVAKAYSVRDRALIVMLLPARTDTKWFHDYVTQIARVELIKGRLKFGGAKNSAPFPSMLVYY